MSVNMNPFGQARKVFEQLANLSSKQVQQILSGNYLPVLKEAAIKGTLPHTDVFRCFVNEPHLFREVHVIDLDAAPYKPNGLTAVEHKKGGQFTWDPSKVRLFLSPNQAGEKTIKGSVLCEELADQPVFNANLLDYLLRYPHLIPKDWEKDENGEPRYIYFPGTKYRGAGGSLYVRFLCFGGEHWRWFCRWLGLGWGCRDLSAIRAD